MAAPSFRDRLLAGEPLFGAWCSLPGALSAELLAGSGADHVVLDLQHGAGTEADLRAALVGVALAGAAPVVRPRCNDFTDIGRVLDLGAHAVIVPNVDSPEQAAAAVAACRYPPDGARSFGPLAEAPRPACVVMVESAAAVRSVAAIAAVPGVDGLYVGPYDLGLSLGTTPGDTAAPPMRAALEEVARAAAAAGVPYGVHTSTGAAAASWRNRGAALLTVAHDVIALRAAVRAELAAAGGPGMPGGPTSG